MSDGAAITAGLLIGLIIVVVVLVLAPYASDAKQPPAELERNRLRTARVVTYMFGVLALGFVGAIFLSDTLPTVLIGINTALYGIGALVLRRKVNGDGSGLSSH